MSDELISQDEIDSLLNQDDGDTTESAKNPDNSGGIKGSADDSFSQDDIDALLGMDDETPSASSDEKDGQASVSQDDIDALLGMDEPETTDKDASDISTETGGSQSKTIENSSDIIDQNEIDSLFGKTEENSPETVNKESDTESSSDELISQADIDGLLDSVEIEKSKHEKLSRKVIQDSTEIISQDELDQLLGNLGDSGDKQEKNKEEKPSAISKNDDSASKTTPPAQASSSSSESDSILSQDDIDALINSIGSDNGDKPEQTKSPQAPTVEKSQDPFPIKVSRETLTQMTSPRKNFKLYDFRRPEKLSRDQVRKIKTYFEAMPRHLTNLLARTMRSRIEINLIEIDQRNYGDMFKGSSSPNLIGVFTLGPGLPNGFIEFSIHQFYCILEKMMGGTGTSIAPIRPVTEFERYLASDIFNQILNIYQDLLNALVQFDPQIELIETDGQMIPKTLSENEILVRMVYEVKINGISGYLNISVPYNFIGPYFAKLKYVRDDGSSHQLDLSKVKLGGNLKKLKVPVSVEFEKKRIRARDTANLTKGGIITLDHPLDRELKVLINNKIKFLGKVGMHGNKMAVKITSTIQEEV